MALLDTDLALAREQERLWAAAQALLPRKDVDIYTQGLMDLGATLCTLRRPGCDRCPLAPTCVARASGTPERWPVKTRRLKRSRRAHALLWLEHRGRVWLVQRPDRGVWAGLWSLPEFADEAALETAVSGWRGEGHWQAAIEHALTHFDWTLKPLLWTWPARGVAPPQPALPAGRWFTREEALALGLPAPIRKLLSR